MNEPFVIETWVSQNLGDRDTNDYFNKVGELASICWRQISTRCSTIELPLCALETRMSPLPTPGTTSIGTFWSYYSSSYIPNSLQTNVLAVCCRSDVRFQPQHKFGLFQANAYVNGVYSNPQPIIDEVSLTAEYSTVQDGSVVLIGRPINLNVLMHDVFRMIAGDIGKLAIYQSTLGGATDLREARREAMRMAGIWLAGTMIHKDPMQGSRRYLW